MLQHSELKLQIQLLDKNSEQTPDGRMTGAFFRLGFVAFFLLASAGVQAGLQEGIDAYEKGDYPAALKEFKPLADSGNASAQSAIGFMYAKGQGAPQDHKAAMAWYLKAANQGAADAQAFLGAMYNEGQGVPQDYKKAAMWYRKAAEQGVADAQSNLGMMYANGQGVPQDDQEAASWYLKAAEQGNVQAQFNLGVMYSNGQGVVQDLIQAYQWFSLAETAVGAEAVNNKNLIGSDMAPRQIEEAQRLAREWREKHKGAINSKF